MEQNIEYKGMTSQPSDYACGDGEMKLAVNAEYRDGGYHAVRVPKVVEFRKEGFEPLFVHRYNDIDHVLYSQLEGSTYYMYYNGEKLLAIGDSNDIQITNVGKIVCFSASDDVAYLFYEESEDRYTVSYLSEVSFFPLYFSALKPKRKFTKNSSNRGGGLDVLDKGTSDAVGHINIHCVTTVSDKLFDDDGNGHLYHELFDGDYLEYDRITEEEKEGENRIFGRLDKLIKLNGERHTFLFPVLIRYAIELIDGSYVCLSPPILLRPECDDDVFFTGKGRYYSNNNLENPGIPNYSSDISEANFSDSSWYQIGYRIKKEDAEKVKALNHNKMVRGISFFISPQINLYNTVHAIAVPYTGDGSTIGREGKAVVRFFKSRKYRDLWRYDRSYYKIKTIEIEDLLSNETDKDIYLLDEDKDSNIDVSDVVNRESLNIGGSQYVISANVLSSYNNRIVLGAITKKMNEEYLNMEMFCTPRHDKDNRSLYYKVDDLEINTKELAWIDIYNDSRDRVEIKRVIKPYGYIPIAFMIPYSGEGKLKLLFKNDILDSSFKCELKLDKSDYETATCYSFANKEKLSKGIKHDIELFSFDENFVTTVYESNLIKISEPNNPVKFNDKDTLYCGNGSLMNVGNIGFELSSGQFGQYPIFGFCSDGIYALSINSTGAIESCSPYSYEILSNKNSIVEYNRTIVFASSNGLIAIDNSGRQLLLSADKTATYAYDQGRSDHQKTFVENFLKGDVMGYGDAPKFADLYTYLTTGVKMAYDYPHGRLIVYNPAYDYSYVMETKSGMWSIMNKSFSRSLNVYEKCLLVDKDGETVYDYSSDDVIESQKAYLITRPFKMGDYNVHKSVQSIIQRGVFCDKEDVKQCLYGSNDLYNWVPVKSSNSIYMRGMRGTGYKYYRSILFIPEFKQNEVLHGASVTYEQRLTNKMR